ncbi:TonB-dependent receptor [Flavihumibacter sp. R14]|nr:TonB-dependent receptor [Flavihumibacter soli]
MKNFTPLVFLYIFYFLSGTPALAQNKGIIRGRIIDSLTREALPFVNITLINTADSSRTLALQSDVKGLFIVSGLSLNTYNIRVGYLGYQSKYLTRLPVTTEKQEINIGDVSLNTSNNTLDEVIIEYKKPTVELLDDKLVYNVDQGVFAEGSLVSDILKNVPMVSVDIDGKATIAGRRNTRIFIDGKPTDFSANNIGELLSVLPSDALESIEVITDPSSKFDADGDGIINLVMKQGRKLGLSGNLSSTAGTLGNYAASAFLSSGKKEKFSFNANGGYSHGSRLSDGSSARSNIFPDTTFYNNQSNSSQRITNGFNSRFSGNWKPDILQEFKFSLRGGYNRGQTSSFSGNLYLNEELFERRLRTQQNKVGNESLEHVIDADYTLKGKNKDQYSFAINYNHNSQDDSQDYSRYLTNFIEAPSSINPELQLNRNVNAGSNLQVSADMNRSFDFLNLRLETGGRYNLNYSDNDQVVKAFDYTVSDFLINSDLTNSFNFRQDIYAGYITVRIKIKEWNLRAGIRAELTNMAFKQLNEEDIDLSPYLNLFPAVALTRTFNGKYRLGLNYNRRITRPRNNFLNPIVDDSDPQNVRFGNINLKPSFTNQYELSFTVFGKGWSVSPRVSYALSNKIIERIKTVVNGNGDTETTYQNLADSKTFSINTFANYQVDKTKTINGGITVSHVDYHSTNSTFNRQGISIRSNAGTSYSINKNTAMEINLNYLKNAVAQGSLSGSVQTQFGLKKNFLKNKMSARITFVDPFSQRNSSSITEGLNFYQESFSVQRTRNFMMAMTYRFSRIAASPLRKA